MSFERVQRRPDRLGGHASVPADARLAARARRFRAVGVDSADPRSDLYAVGAVGYFLLTGVPVFDAKTSIEVFAHHLHTEPVRPSTRLGVPVPDDLEALVLACLEKDPERRPSSAADLSSRLSATRSGREFTKDAARAAWEKLRALASSPPSHPATPALLTVELEQRRAPARAGVVEGNPT